MPVTAAKQNIPILLLALAALASLLTLSPLQEGWSAGADAPGLVAAYSFDEGSGSTTEDETGNGRTGTVSGAGWTSEGRFGGALVFDGHNDLVSVPDADGLHLTGAMTLEAWVKPTGGTAGWRPAIVKMLGGNRDYALYATSEGGGPSGHVHSSAGEQYVASASAVAVGSWSHVAMTYDGSRIDVYVNGSAVASHPASGAVDASTDALQIGGNAASAEWFAGAIDEVRVYNRALSSPEIAADMAERLGGPSAVAPANQQAPVVSGTPEVKSTLSASPGSWSGTAPMSFTYAWFRCDAGGSSCSPISGAAEQTYTLAQADAGATLRVQVTASNEAGSQSATSAQTPLIQQQQPPGKKPSPADTQPPTTPTGLALALRAGEATLTWKPAMDDVGVSGYGVYKDGARIASTATESYVVSGLLCGSVVLGIDAFDAAGNRSAQATVTTPARPCSDVQAPTAPTSLRVTRQTDSRVSVAWDASSDDVAVTGYGVYRDDTRLDTAAHTTYTLTGLSCGRRYVLDVDAFDAAGNRSAQATVAVDTARCTQRVLPRTGGDVTPPTAPERLTAGTVTSTSVGLEWAASVDNVSVAGYGVYFGDLRIASTAQTGYAFSGLNCGSSYIVGVDAYDQAGNRSTRASAVVATAACSDTAAPTTPLNVVQGGATQTSISIAWNGSTDNVGVSGYGMYRADTRVATTSQTSYTFSGLTCGSVYALGVDAYDAAGNRSGRENVWMATATCLDTSAPTTPQALVATGSTASSVSVAWKASTDDVGVTAYQVYRDGFAVSDTASLSFTIGGLDCGTSYGVAVEARDASGNTSEAARTTAATAACAPSSSPASVYVSLWGVDSNPCIQALPCATFNRAYRAAGPGRTVEVAGGSYGYQRIEFDPSKTSSDDVVFQPAVGAAVKVEQIDLGQAQLNIPSAQHLTIQNMAVGYLRAWDGSRDITWRNIRGRTFDVFSETAGVTQDVSVLGGVFGPCEAPREEACTVRLTGRNVLVDGVTIYGVTSTDLVNWHVDGMFIRGCNGCVVRNSKFYANMVTNIRIQDCCALPQSGNLVLENNWFAPALEANGTSKRYNGIDIDTPINGLLIRNNSFAERAGIIVTSPNAAVGARIVGNLLGNQYCAGGASYSRNLFIPFSEFTGQQPCSATDRKVTSFGYVNAGGFDYHLAPGSPAIGAGDTGNCATTDIDGQSRSRCDAGSDEA